MTSANSISFNQTINSTNSNGTDLAEDAIKVWVASITFTFVVTFLLIYATLALSYHGYKKKTLIGCRGGALSNKEKTTAIVNSLILFAAVTTLVYVGVAIPLVYNVEHPYCAVQHRVKITFFALSLFSVYTALWYRVYTSFYANPILKEVATEGLRCVNLSSMLFLFVLTIVNLVLFYSVPGYETTPLGCRHIQSKNTSYVKWMVLAITTIAFQTTLLFSFIYPLTAHNRNMSSRGLDARSVHPVMKRAAIVAAVCSGSDLVNAGFAVVYTGQTTYVNHIVYSCNLCINLLGVIMSFADWKEKLFPWTNCIDSIKVEISTSAAARSKLNSGVNSGSDGL